MSKSEFKSVIEEDVESGQCSEDEVKLIKTEKKSKKKKSTKSRKYRKRKHSSSSSSDESSREFFNPYSVNPEKFMFKEEYSEVMEGEDEGQCNGPEGITCEHIIAETFNNLNNIEQDNIANNLPITETVLERQDKSKDVYKELQMLQSVQRKQAMYFRDVSGIDTINGDLYHYLSDLGLSSSLVDDLLKVMSMEEEIEPDQENEDDDGYEEQMINDIPIIDQSDQCEQSFNGGYSPEHVAQLVDPYKPQQHKSVSYAPQQSKKSDIPIPIIDPLSIPAVGPRDPRLINTKTLLQSKSVTVNKPAEVIPDKSSISSEITPAMNIDWETTVTNVVKTHLTLYLTHNDINKEEYKSILKRAVNKILSCGERKLETDKISKFLHSYVTMTQKTRIMNNV